MNHGQWCFFHSLVLFCQHTKITSKHNKQFSKKQGSLSPYSKRSVLPNNYFCITRSEIICTVYMFLLKELKNYGTSKISTHTRKMSGKILQVLFTEERIITRCFQIKFTGSDLQPLKFNVQLRLSWMSRVEFWKLSNVSTSIVVAIFRVNM
jgi:hypothetical protein